MIQIKLFHKDLVNLIGDRHLQLKHSGFLSERVRSTAVGKRTDRDAKNIVNGDCSRKIVFLIRNVSHLCEVVVGGCELRLSARAEDQLTVLQHFYIGTQFIFDSLKNSHLSRL